MHEHANERSADHDLRERIDTLVGELSPQGKFELATRLMLEGAREFILRDRSIPAIVARELPVGELDTKRDDGGRGEL